MKIVVVGGGFGGCAAAYMARKQGAEVTLLERTDMLLGTGLVGGIFRNNGRFTAAEELILLGGGDLVRLCDANALHENVEFPGHKHASLYDVNKMSGIVTRYLRDIGVEIRYKERITKAERKGDAVRNIESESGTGYEADAYVDATGTAGPVKNCRKYGNGCAMCILRCPSFGGRVSLCSLVGVEEMVSLRGDGEYGSISGSCKLNKDSLEEDVKKELEEKGCYLCPVPEELREDHLEKKSCQQYALQAYVEYVVLLDTGHAKMMTSYFPLEKLRKLPGFGNVRYEDPYAGGIGNSMRFFDMPLRDDAMRVKGVCNLLVAGEKAGLLVGHTEAMVTGELAGFNAVRIAKGEEPFVLPRETAAGEGIAFAREGMESEEGRRKRYTFSGSVLFENMKRLGLYETDVGRIKDRMDGLGLIRVFGFHVFPN